MQNNNVIRLFQDTRVSYIVVEDIHRELGDSSCVVKAYRVTASSPENIMEPVVVKCYKRPLSARDMRHVRREVAALYKIQSEHVTALREVTVFETHIFVAMECVNGKSLRKYIGNGTSTLDESEVHRIFRKVLLAVRDMHSVDIVHRDVKPQNIIYNRETREVKVCDLNFAKLSSQNCRTKLGSIKYLPPEVLNLSAYICNNSCYNGKSVDIWSLGITLFLMLTNEFPFALSICTDENEVSAASMYETIRRSDFQFLNRVSEPWQRILGKMLKKNPEERSTADELLQDPWVQQGIRTYLLPRSFTENRSLQTESQIASVLNSAVMTNIGEPIDMTVDDSASFSASSSG